MAVEGGVEPVWDYRVGMRYRVPGSQLKCVFAGEDRLQKFLEYVTPQGGARHELRLSEALAHLAEAAAALYGPLRAAAVRLIDGAQRAAGRKAPPGRQTGMGKPGRLRVLVTDAFDKKALAAVRFLARDGCIVGATGPHWTDQCLHCKFAAESFVSPNPVGDGDAWADFMLDYLSRKRWDAVLPMSDYTTLTLSGRAEDFAKVTNICVPPWDVLQLARDKPRISDLAASLGIAVPKTWQPSSLDEVRTLAGEVPYPVVVKYKRGTGSVGLRYARSRDELIACYGGKEHAKDMVFDDTFPMIQQYIPGETRDVAVLFCNGEPRGLLSSRRALTLPATGGRGVVNEVLELPALKEIAVRLLRRINYHGPGQVEFKYDPSRDEYYFLEVNTRFWGGVGFACEAGINFPVLTARLAVEGDIEGRFEHLNGMYYRWPFPLELQSVLERPDRFTQLLEYFNRFRRGMRYDVWPSDPMPHLWDWFMYFYRRAKSSKK